MDTRTRFFVFEGDFFRLCGVFYVLRCFFYVLIFFVERVSCVLATVGRGTMKDGSVFNLNNRGG